MRKKLSRDYNLAVLYPEIAKEWHPTKNGDLKPSNLLPQSNKKVWWICKKGHEWKASIGGRYGSEKRKGSGCLNCYRESRELVLK